MTLIDGLALLLAAATGAACDRMIVGRTVNGLRRRLAVVTHDATHDRLTGLLNRGGLLDAYDAGTHTARWLLIVDVDEFKTVNDRHGHPTGDLVLATLGARIADLVADTAGHGGRLGGDEFAIILPQRDPRDLARTAALLAVPITITGRGTGTVTVSVSIGITAVPATTSWTDAISDADIALYQAKLHRQPVTFDSTMTYPHPPWPRRQVRDHHARRRHTEPAEQTEAGTAETAGIGGPS